MRKASNSFASGALPQKLLPALGMASVPTDLRKVADAFRELQDERHGADYDLLLRYTRTEALWLIDLSERAMQIWPTVAPTPAGRLYLVALLAGERIRE
jgi:hypothetical protein